ncbi:hypothetical protein [Allonocardiopsis opalescens]|uniref:Uncharacterized protein n=1 Tax=Allonocardiopsis opalescens TaxID=1144618 RepID=A0A2T0Q022_9ACTN|nr:hypothetical protein [Allonocardiopsis opalescens]PRX97137.1 hypothetical protein CLV72_106173 [Allonocardiopsis opalescens]
MPRSHAENRPYVVPGSLRELTGPVSDVELPNRLDRAPDLRYDLAVPEQRNAMYERVIRESGTVRDLRRYINSETLVRIWPELVLPRQVRRLWEFQLAEPRAVV